MDAFITEVTAVRALGDNLSVVNVRGVEHSVVANRLADGSFRWEVGETVAYIPEGMIVPEDVLKARGYWDEENEHGLLEGKKRNRVKMRRFGPEEDRVESRGLLFKVSVHTRGPMADDLTISRGSLHMAVEPDMDVSEFLGLEEHAA